MASVSRIFAHRDSNPKALKAKLLEFTEEAKQFLGEPITTSFKFINNGNDVEYTLTRVEPMATIRDMLGAPAKGQPMKKSVLGLGRLKGVMDELRNDVRKEVDGAVDLAVSVKRDATQAVDGFKQTLNDVREEVASVVDELNQVSNGGPE